MTQITLEYEILCLSLRFCLLVVFRSTARDARARGGSSGTKEQRKRERRRASEERHFHANVVVV